MTDEPLVTSRHRANVHCVSVGPALGLRTWFAESAGRKQVSHSSGFVFLSLYVTFVFCVSASDLCLFSPLFLFIFARRPLGQKSVSGFIIQAPSFIYNSRCWCLLSRKLKDESGIFDFLLVKMYFFFFFFPGVSWSRWRRSSIRGESAQPHHQQCDRFLLIF